MSFTWFISVDDHLIEPAHLFEGRVPAALADRAPRVVVDDAGREQWLYEGQLYPQVGLNAVAGRPKEEWSMEPARFDEMRPGCYDVDARVRDMDIDGTYASLCFPSLIAGFAGTVFARSKDSELGLACLRAWNDWHREEWAGPHPDRIIALQRALADYGYGQIRPTGIIDGDTRAAIEQFERERKLPITGQASDRVVRELAAMTGRPLE